MQNLKISQNICIHFAYLTSNTVWQKVQNRIYCPKNMDALSKKNHYGRKQRKHQNLRAIHHKKLPDLSGEKAG